MFIDMLETSDSQSTSGQIYENGHTKISCFCTHESCLVRISLSSVSFGRKKKSTLELSSLFNCGYRIHSSIVIFCGIKKTIGYITFKYIYSYVNTLYAIISTLREQSQCTTYVSIVLYHLFIIYLS